MSAQKQKAQASVEYLLLTAFMLVIIVAIFAVSLITSDQNIKTRQISESLNQLVQTADLVYAMGKNNVLFTEVIWPVEVQSISVLHLCKTNAELSGCSGPATQTAACNACAPAAGGCGMDSDCIKVSAIKLTSSTLGGADGLIYPSKAKLSILDPANFLATNARHAVKVSWTDTGLVQLEKYSG